MRNTLTRVREAIGRLRAAELTYSQAHAYQRPAAVREARRAARDLHDEMTKKGDQR